MPRGESSVRVPPDLTSHVRRRWNFIGIDLWNSVVQGSSKHDVSRGAANRGAEEDAEPLEPLEILVALKRERRDEQAHREPDSAQQGAPVELSPTDSFGKR